MTPLPDRPTGPEIAARMAQSFERHPPERRGNPVGWVMICAAVVVVLALLT